MGKRQNSMTNVFGSGVHAELFSNKEVIIDGIRGVLEYSDLYIKLNIGKGTLDIYGSELEISALNAEGIVICGKIEKIEFCI